MGQGYGDLSYYANFAIFERAKSIERLIGKEKIFLKIFYEQHFLQS